MLLVILNTICFIMFISLGSLFAKQKKKYLALIYFMGAFLWAVAGILNYINYMR